MNDRFLTLKQCATMVEGELHGDPELRICGVGDLLHASSCDLAFITKPQMLPDLEQSAAAAFIVPEEIDGITKPFVKVRDPILAITTIHLYFSGKSFEARGIDASCQMGSDCSYPDQVNIGPLCVLGDRVRLGERVHLHAGVVLMDDVTIGDDCVLYPNVTLYPFCQLGARVTIHGGTVVGSDGYGYVVDRQGHHLKRPHVGRVVIEDDVEIGANCCVDRATFGETRIRRGTKIDNLVQIAHNVEVGEDNLLVAQVGIAGSTVLGRHVVMGGNSGVAGHVTLGDNVMIAAKAGVHSDVPSNSVLAGYPAVPRERWLRQNAVLTRLPEMRREMKKLKKEIEELRGLLTRGNNPE